MAYHKILIPLDGSLVAEEALKQVNSVAAPGAAILLLSVMSLNYINDVAILASQSGVPFEPIDPNVPSHTQDMDADEIATRQDYLIAVSQALTDAGYQVSVQVKTMAIIADVIANSASSGDYEVIIMATHGRTGLSKLIIGSVTQAVIDHGTCPVLVVPPLHKPPFKAEPVTPHFIA